MSKPLSSQSSCVSKAYLYIFNVYILYNQSIIYLLCIYYISSSLTISVNHWTPIYHIYWSIIYTCIFCQSSILYPSMYLPTFPPIIYYLSIYLIYHVPTTKLCINLSSTSDHIRWSILVNGNFKNGNVIDSNCVYSIFMVTKILTNLKFLRK